MSRKRKPEITKKPSFIPDELASKFPFKLKNDSWTITKKNFDKLKDIQGLTFIIKGVNKDQHENRVIKQLEKTKNTDQPILYHIKYITFAKEVFK